MFDIFLIRRRILELDTAVTEESNQHSSNVRLRRLLYVIHFKFYSRFSTPAFSVAFKTLEKVRLEPAGAWGLESGALKKTREDYELIEGVFGAFLACSESERSVQNKAFQLPLASVRISFLYPLSNSKRA